MFIYTITSVFSLVGIIYLLRRGEMSPRTGFVVITVTLGLFFFVLVCAGAVQ
jgi:hypothetical protein